ncbi:MAG: AMP-binding protein [Myxococcota bacterium]
MTLVTKDERPAPAALPTPLAAHDATAPVAWSTRDERGVRAGELRAAAHAIAAELPPLAPEAREVVVLCRDRALFAAALLGAWEAGYTVALPPNAQPGTVRELRQRPGVATVLHGGESDRGIDVSGALSAATSERALRPLAPERTVVTLHTSGSTGPSAAHPKSTRQLLGEVGTLARAFPALGRGHVVSVPPPHHIYGLLFGVLTPLAFGGVMERGGLAAGDDPSPLLGALPEASRVLVTIPAHLRVLALRHELPLPSMRRVLSSGAPLPASTAEALATRCGWRITEVLGSTETGGLATRERGADAPGPWTPFPGVEVSVGAEERLIVRSPLLREPGGRYVSGDRVRLLADGSGRFEHLGRADGVVKVGALRVDLRDLQQRVLDLEGVADAAVLAEEVGGSRGWEIWAVVALAPGVHLDRARLRKALRPHVPPVALPRRARFVARLPREPNGKLPRRALRALFDEAGT